MAIVNRTKFPLRGVSVNEQSIINDVATLMLKEFAKGGRANNSVSAHLESKFRKTVMTVGGGLYAVMSEDMTLHTHIGDLKLLRGSVFTPYTGCMQIHYGIVNGDDLENRVLINTLVEMTNASNYSAVDLCRPTEV